MTDFYENMGTQTIERPQFVEKTEKLLADLQDPQTSIDQVVEIGGQVLSVLHDIDVEDVEIVPPLNDEQKKSFYQRAKMAVNIGEQALEAMSQTTNQAEKSRPKNKNKRFSARGEGSGAKR